MTTKDYQKSSDKLSEFIMIRKYVRDGLTTTPVSVIERLNNVVKYFKKERYGNNI